MPYLFMPRLFMIDLVPRSLWFPILTPHSRAVTTASLRVAAKWTIEAVSAVLACIAVSGIAIGFASVGDGEDGFFELATQFVQTFGELLR